MEQKRVLEFTDVRFHPNHVKGGPPVPTVHFGVGILDQVYLHGCKVDMVCVSFQNVDGDKYHWNDLTTYRKVPHEKIETQIRVNGRPDLVAWVRTYSPLGEVMCKVLT